MSIWFWLPAIPIAAVLIGLARARWLKRDRQRRYHQAIEAFRTTSKDPNAGTIGLPENEPGPCAADWYLWGAVLLRQGRPREAARAFGIAHHADWRLGSAALLTFAALKAAAGDEAGIIEQIVSTWHELKQPELPKHEEDRMLIDALAESCRPVPGLSTLGRLTWAVVAPAEQARIEQLIVEKPNWARPLLPPA